MRPLIPVVALALAVAACKKKEAPAPDAAAAAPAPRATPAPQPAPAVAPLPKGEVLGRGAVGSIDELVASIEPYLAAMGASRLHVSGAKATIGGWIGLSSWDGVDGARPIHFWVLNPKKYRPPLLVALPVQKGKSVQTKGWASQALGEHTILARDAATIAALRTVAERELAEPAGVSGAAVRVSVSVDEVLGAYEPEVQRMLGRLTSALGAARELGVGDELKKLVAWQGRGLLDLARQIGDASAELSAGKDHARLVLRLRPRPGSGLADLLAAPKQPFPGSVSKLPGDAAFAIAAAYAPEALRRAAEKVAAHMESLGKEGPLSFAGAVRNAAAPFFGSIRGDWSFVRRVGGGGVSVHLIGTREPKKSLEALRALLQKTRELLGQAGPMGAQAKAAYTKQAGTHKGVKYDRLRVVYDFSKLSGFQGKLMETLFGKVQDTYVAAKGEYLVMTSGKGGDARSVHEALDLLDARRSGLSEKPEFKELLAQAPPDRFLVLYFSFVDYLKSTISALGAGAGGALVASVPSRGYIGGALTAEGGALRLDAVATRSQIESIKKIFDSLRPRKSGPVGK
jgi:hypothetical protein